MVDSSDSKPTVFPWTTIFGSLVVLGVFASVFFLTQVLVKPSSEQVLDGVRVVGSKEQFRAVLFSSDPVLIEMQLFSGNDTRNTALTKVTADVASTLVQYQKRAGVYGSVEGNASINCVAQTNFCKGAVIVVRTGPCNCLSVKENQIFIEGTSDFISDFAHIKVYKGVLGLSLAS